MKVKVNGIVDVVCEGCGGSTRLTPDYKYNLPKDLMCNCTKVENVDLTKSEPIKAETIDEVLTGLMNGAELSEFDQDAQKLYANYFIKEFETDKQEGVVQDENDVAQYNLCLGFLGQGVLPSLEPEGITEALNDEESENDDETVDLTKLKKKELKGICAEQGIDISHLSRPTNDDLIELILADQEAE